MDYNKKKKHFNFHEKNVRCSARFNSDIILWFFFFFTQTLGEMYPVQSIVFLEANCICQFASNQCILVKVLDLLLKVAVLWTFVLLLLVDVAFQTHPVTHETDCCGCSLYSFILKKFTRIQTHTLYIYIY